jgi:hypothetical protein
MTSKIDEAFERMVKRIHDFLQTIAQYKRKTSTINSAAFSMIQFVSNLYQELYDLSDEIKHSNPEIKDGKTLKNLLREMYDQSTLPNMTQFMFLVDLLKVIMLNFINELKRNQRTDALRQVAQEIDSKCSTWYQQANFEHKPLVYLENNKPMIDDDAFDILKKYFTQKVTFSCTAAEKLLVRVPKQESDSLIVKEILEEFLKKFSQKVCEKLEISIEQPKLTQKILQEFGIITMNSHFPPWE